MKNGPEKDKYVGTWYLGPTLFKAKLVRSSKHNDPVLTSFDELRLHTCMQV